MGEGLTGGRYERIVLDLVSRVGSAAVKIKIEPKLRYTWRYLCCILGLSYAFPLHIAKLAVSCSDRT